MSANVIALSYLAASVLFILSLRGLSHPLTARRGNVFGIVGMSIAVAATLAITVESTYHSRCSQAAASWASSSPGGCR